MKTKLGKDIISQFKMMKIEIQLKKTVESSRFITYYYDLKNPLQILKVTPRLIDVIKDFNKKNLFYRKEERYSFSISVQKDIPTDLSLESLTQPKALSMGEPIAINIGRGMLNEDIIINFDTTNHMLIAGATGSGKSVLMNSIIYSLIGAAQHQDIELKLIDPKRVSFNAFKSSPGVQLITEAADAEALFDDAISLMESRYELMEEKMITDKNIFTPVFIIVDELSELMMTSADTCESKLVRLLQKSRQANIHVILATQRPTKDVISGSIKAQCDTRICLKMASKRDSVTVIDKGIAQELLGRGDAYIKYPDRTDEIRFQVARVSDESIIKICESRTHNNASISASTIKRVISNTISNVNIRTAITECVTNMRSWGYDIADISWKEEQSKEWLGLINYNIPCIILNDKLSKMTDESIRITIYHELAHLVAGPKAKHAGRWKEVTEDISKRTGLIFKEKAMVKIC